MIRENILTTWGRGEPFLAYDQTREQKDYSFGQIKMKTPIEQKPTNDMENESQTGGK